MGELVYLAEYRQSLQVLADKARCKRLPTIRFFDGHYYDQLWFPPTCGGSDALVSVTFDDSVPTADGVRYDLVGLGISPPSPYRLPCQDDTVFRFE